MNENSGLHVLSLSALEALLTIVGRAKHDLGKYMAMDLRWLPPDTTAHDLRQALRADLCRTRTGVHTETAVQIWARFRRQLVGEASQHGSAPVQLLGDVDFITIDQAMARIAEGIPRIDHLPMAELLELKTQALAAAEGLHRLHRRVRKAHRAKEG